MEIAYTVVYHAVVVREDIPKLSAAMKERIKKAIEERLMTSPDLFGIPLRRSLKGHRKLRVGDYRIVFRIVGKTVTVLAIQHRSVVYQSVEKRTK